MDQESEISVNESHSTYAIPQNISEYMKEKILKIPDKLSMIERPLLGMETTEEEKMLFDENETREDDDDDLTMFKMVIFCLPAFSKMAALVIFK